MCDKGIVVIVNTDKDNRSSSCFSECFSSGSFEEFVEFRIGIGLHCINFNLCREQL